MSDFLTQRDVDAILEGREPDPSTDPAKKVVPYSFLRPPRISKERWASIESLYERFASQLSGMLTLRLQTPVDALVTGIEQVVYWEFVLSLSTPCACFPFQVGERPDRRGVIDLGSATSFYLLERLFGGPGDEELPKRALTPLEETVVRGIAERAAQILRHNWEEQLQIDPELKGFESDPELLQIADRDENVLVTIVEIRSGEFRSFVTVCIPISILEPFLRSNVADASPIRFRTEGNAKANRERVESGLQHAHLTLTARLPIFLLRARSVTQLRVGQTIDTAHPIDTPVELHLNGRARFRGSIGQVRRRFGLQISESGTAPTSDRPGRAKEGRVL
jgi:flagellar motor switch protein FliM